MLTLSIGSTDSTHWHRHSGIDVQMVLTGVESTDSTDSCGQYDADRDRHAHAVSPEGMDNRQVQTVQIQMVPTTYCITRMGKGGTDSSEWSGQTQLHQDAIVGPLSPTRQKGIGSTDSTDWHR